MNYSIAQKIKQMYNSKTERRLTILLHLSYGFILVLFFFTNLNREVNVDAAYYLGVVDSIYDGLIPIRDFQLGYTPLSFYLMLIVRVFTHNFTVYLQLMLFMLVLASYILYKIVLKLTENKNLSLLSTILLLIQSYLFEGTYFVLEPITIFFGLLSVYYLFNAELRTKNLLLSGLFASAAFMSKQYGLAYLAGNMVFLVLVYGSYSEKIKRLLYIGIGFIVIPVIFTVYFIFNGVSVAEAISSFMGGGYGKRESIFWKEGISALFNIRYFLTIFLIAIPYVLYKNRRLIPIVFALITIVFLLTFQFYFQLFAHYYILIFPFILILFTLISKIHHKVIGPALVVIMILSSLYLGKKVVRDTLYTVKSSPLKVQMFELQNVERFLYDNDIVFSLSVKYASYYFLLDKKPPLFEKYGFSFGNETTDELIDKINNATVILVERNLLDNLADKMPDVSACIYKNGFEGIYSADNLTVLRKSMETY